VAKLPFADDVASIAGLMAQRLPFIVAELGMQTLSCCTSMLLSPGRSDG
jgi:hypothetical protein